MAYYKDLREHIKALEANILCPGHLFVYSGADTVDYLERAETACIDFRRMVETLAKVAGGQQSEIIRKIKAIEYDSNPGPKQPEPAYLINLEARIKAVLKAVR